MRFTFDKIGLKIGDEITHVPTKRKYLVGCTGGGTLLQDYDDGYLITLTALTKKLSNNDNTDYLKQWTYCDVMLSDMFKERKRIRNIFRNIHDSYTEKQRNKKARKTMTTPYEIIIGFGKEQEKKE
ncbi:MAG: hypothetical protein ABSF43_08170 [Rectinemataceae bacterium]|jgi:hypothetical protein